MKVLRLLLCIILLSAVNAAHCRTYLVAVGVNDYSHFPGRPHNLTCAEADARAIANLYARKSSADYVLLTGKNATRSNVISSVRKLSQYAGGNDRIVFFFSGHGTDSGVCTRDANLTYADIRKAMAGGKCKTKIMIVDACMAGGSRKQRASNNASSASAKKADVMLFLSSRDNENSAESPINGQGLFTYWLLRGLTGEADANRDLKVSAKEIFNFVHKGVSTSNRRQHPVMWGNFNGNMSVL
ncbi:MAG: caspase family protein [Prevotella sp.]|nr:caspase family protein [Prevotella sp.]MCM1074153.1 caspase family protein [Ruminococcus sp.]